MKTNYPGRPVCCGKPTQAIEAPKIDKETAKARLSEIRARMGRVE